ncbi:MAG: hypothetical protein IJ087_05065 [Eggerthellaceae bacterium]|nr:hypothetical protein [Eggerthellaceae bacterium]
MITTRCVVCGQEFEAVRKSAKYCSNKCKQKKKRGVYAPVWRESTPDISVAAAPVECEAMVQEAHRLANDFGRLSKTAPYQLQAKFARLSTAIQGALEDEGL